MSKPNDLVQGTLDLLLLKILALEPLHGWAVGLRLKSISGDVLQVTDGSLYPALHKLEQEGWITAEWKQTENNRRVGRVMRIEHWWFTAPLRLKSILRGRLLATYAPARRASRIAPTLALRYE